MWAFSPIGTSSGAPSGLLTQSGEAIQLSETGVVLSSVVVSVVGVEAAEAQPKTTNITPKPITINDIFCFMRISPFDSSATPPAKVEGQANKNSPLWQLRQ
jgi:hypothetical protein